VRRAPQVRCLAQPQDRSKDAFARMPYLGHVSDPYDADKLASITWRDVTKTSLWRKVKAKFS
jgi:hypothetical protein